MMIVYADDLIVVRYFGYNYKCLLRIRDAATRIDAASDRAATAARHLTVAPGASSHSASSAIKIITT